MLVVNFSLLNRPTSFGIYGIKLHVDIFPLKLLSVIFETNLFEKYFVNKKNAVRFAYVLFYFISYYLFVLTFAMKLKHVNYKSYWNILVFGTNEKWCYIWICPMEKCLILFHFHCLGSLSHKIEKFWFCKSLKSFKCLI